MTTVPHRESAKIYQFPVRVRAATGVNPEGGKPVVELSPRVAKAAFGSGWYHDAAIQDAEQELDHRATPFAS